MIIIIQNHVCLDHAWHECGTRLSSHNKFHRSIMKWFIFFTHFCDCSVTTALVYRSNCAKNSCNRVLVTIIFSLCKKRNELSICLVLLNLDSNSWTLVQSCNVVNPGEIFHSNSSGSPSILSNVLYSWDIFEPLQCLFPCSVWLRVLVYLTKKQYIIWKDVDLRALKIDNSFVTNQRHIFPWMIFPTNCFHSINLILFGHQFRSYVEHFFHCEIFCILDGMLIVWVIFPMNNADSNVTDMNILHITECFSSFSVTFIEDRFCLHRTSSFTLSKNDLDPNDNSNSASSSPTMNWCGIAPLWGQTTGFSVLSWVSSSSRIKCLVFSWEKLNWNSCPCTRGDNGFLRSVIHQFTLEETKLSLCPTLSSVLSTSFQQIVCGGAPTHDLRHGRQRVAPFYHLSQHKHSKDSDFHGFSSPGFLTPKMTELRGPCNKTHHWPRLRCDSFFNCFLLRSFRHHFRTNFITEMANFEQTQKMIPFITCEISFG